MGQRVAGTVPRDCTFRLGAGQAGNPHRDSSHVVRRTPLDIDIGTIQPIVALAAGVLILLIPRLLNYIVAIYLIIIGVTGLIS